MEVLNCQQCQYDLRGTPPTYWGRTCPECGRVNPLQTFPKHVSRTWFLCLAVAIGLSPVLCAIIFDWMFGLLYVRAVIMPISGVLGGMLSGPLLSRAWFGSDWRASSSKRKANSLVFWAIVAMALFGSVGVLVAYLASRYGTPFC